MHRTRTLPWLALLLALSMSAEAALMCPITPPAAPCLDLEVGAVSTLRMVPGQRLCVKRRVSGIQKYGITALNFTSVSQNASFTVTNVAPVGEKAAQDTWNTGGLLALEPASQTEPVTPAEVAAEAAAAHAEITALLNGPRRSEAQIATSLGKSAITPHAVGDILDIQAAPGCSGALDMRKARIEAVSAEAAGKPRIYVAEEVISDGSGGWQAPVAGGFSRTAYESIAIALSEAYTIDVLTVLGTSTLTRSGALDSLLTYYGEPTDVDNNGGIILFFTPRLNEDIPPASASIIHARFDVSNLLDSSACPRSNEREIVFSMVPDPAGQVNSNVRSVSNVVGNLIRATTHQIARLIMAGRRLYVTDTPAEEPWLEEILAWFSSDALFYTASHGLAPGTPIKLTDLTTGATASRRVAAFNAYIHPSFASLRDRLFAASGSTPVGRASILETNPANAAVFATENERIGYYYGAAMHVLRYLLDHHAGDDAALMRALVDSNDVGTANLEAVFGTDMRAALRDFTTAFMFSNQSATLTGAHTTPSWNHRSVLGGLGGAPVAHGLTTGGAAFLPIIGPHGAVRWMDFSVPSVTGIEDPASSFQYLPNATGGVLVPLEVTVVRLQ